jgi:hypothetical protein
LARRAAAVGGIFADSTLVLELAGHIVSAKDNCTGSRRIPFDKGIISFFFKGAKRTIITAVVRLKVA